MIAAKSGHRYLIIKQKIFLRRNACPSFVISSSILSTPTTFDTRRQVAIAAIGIITEFVVKSKKSRNCIPRILKFARGPYPRQESVPSSNITIPMTQLIFYGSSVVHLRTSKQHFLSVRSNLSQLQTVLIRKIQYRSQSQIPCLQKVSGL